MSAAVQKGAPRGHGDGQGAAGRLVRTLVLLGIAMVLLAILRSLGSERRAVRALPSEERVALLARTVDEMRQFCGERRPEALEKHCRDLATFAAQFDECRGECEALVRREFAPASPR